MVAYVNKKNTIKQNITQSSTITSCNINTLWVKDKCQDTELYWILGVGILKNPN